MAKAELTRDAYGFTVRPHHLSRYKEYAIIYEEEEAERSSRWEQFLSTYEDPDELSKSLESTTLESSRKADNDTCDAKGEFKKFETWGQIRSTLRPVERALRYRFQKSGTQTNGAGTDPFTGVSSPRAYESVESEDDSDEEFYDVDGLQSSADTFLEGSNEPIDCEEEPCPWKEELDALVRGGVPMALRGELWQVFMGSSVRRVLGHYQALLTLLADGGGAGNGSGGLYDDSSSEYKLSDSGIIEKWTNQIEKDLPRTFPGHPALGEDGRNALRHLLTAYARHNPNVGYCQAMNFFAGLLLLMMPEENAFWTLAGILDNCFEGYYSENMLESQVDQLVLEELVCKHFPRLASHLDTLGLQVAWVTGPWFLSIFVNILPWESVLRVWDVLLYEGNRSMLFRTTLALLELYGPAVMATKDAGDAVTLLQSSAASTFDSSQLVLTACVGYSCVDELQLQELRLKYRPQVLAKFSGRLIDRSIWHKAYGPISFSSKLYNYDKTKNAIKDLQLESQSVESLSISTVEDTNHHVLNSKGTDEGDLLSNNISNGVRDNATMLADLAEQMSSLKLELSKALEERRAANLRADELETAFMELVKEDNRRLLSAKVETLETEVNYLKQALKDKVEQEQAMVQVMVRMEQEQRITEDGRRFAEDDAKTQRATVNELQAKYDATLVSLKELEKRTAMAESMLEATLQYQALNNGQVPPKRSSQGEEQSRWSWSWNTSKSGDLDGSSGTVKADNGNDSSQVDASGSQGLLSRRFSLAWRDRAKSKVEPPQTQESVEHDSGFSPKSLSPQSSDASSYS